MYILYIIIELDLEILKIHIIKVIYNNLLISIIIIIIIQIYIYIIIIVCIEYNIRLF